jgi:hypothetical protein
MRRPNLRIICIYEEEDFQLKRTVNIFSKIIEENFPNLKKEIPWTYKKPTEIQIVSTRRERI